LYTDLSFFTADEQIGEDVTELFNSMTGYPAPRQYQKLLVAPGTLRLRMEELIRTETQHVRQGERGHIILKMNSLDDANMIRLLYEASQAGVTVDLFVRGICCLRPGVDGVSSNIRVTSLVGRFLEHSRIFYFRNGGAEKIYLGSADLMGRNLDHRVEVLFPVENPQLISHLRDDILANCMADTRNARRMLSDGTYERHGGTVNSQERFLRQG
jgi:polyphosphate kinase